MHTYDGSKLNQNSLIIDVGALYGDWTEKFINRHKCYIEAYEPSRDNYDKLKSFESDKVKCFPYAVCGESGESVFYVYGYGWDGGANSLTKHDGGKHTLTESYTVKIISLDEILKKHKSVDLLKLDCEGCEIQLLKVTDIEELKKCKQICVEFHSFCKHLHISDKDVNDCVSRLSPYFDFKKTEKKHPDYLFTRRGMNQKMLSHINLIISISKMIDAKSYLELGISYGKTFNSMSTIIKIAHGVDILDRRLEKCGEFFKMSTDDFFKICKTTYDLIFIDANHSYNNVKKDFENSLNVLNKSGVIIIHDTDPENEAVTNARWSGTSYKILEYIINNHKELDVITLPQIDISSGLTIIRRKKDLNILNWKQRG